MKNQSNSRNIFPTDGAFTRNASEGELSNSSDNKGQDLFSFDKRVYQSLKKG